MDPPSERSGSATRQRRRRRTGARTAPGISLGAWSWGLLCTATVGSALALGALHPPTLVVVAVLVFAAAALTMWGRGFSSIPAPAWILFGLAAYTALQALPLPLSWVRLLSPGAGEIWQRAFEIAPGAHWASISVDRGATLVEVLKWSTYGAAFIAAASFGAARNMARGLLLPLASALLVAFVTLSHGLAGARSIYGFYEPTFDRSIWHMGPLLNPNHLASYLNFGLLCGLGLLMARRRPLPAWALGLAISFLIPNAIVAGSRGGVVGLVVGLVAFFVVLPRRRHADPDFGPVPKLTGLASLASVLLVAIGFTGLLASEETKRQLYEVNIDKLRLLTWCQELIADYRWFGVGRGAFESVFPAYRSGVSNEIYTHPENLPAQWLGEWGIPIGLAAVVAFCWSFRPRRLGARWSVIASGVVAAVAAILVQNFVDFGLEVPAIALSVIVGLGVCWGHANAQRREEQTASSTARPIVSFALVGLALCLSAFVIVSGFRPLVYERRALASAYEALGEAAPETIEALRETTFAAVLAHPAEPYFYRMGALLTWRLRQDPMPWLQRALDRGPSIGRTHLLVARVLASRRAVRQGLFQLRLAATFDPNLVPVAGQAAAAWTDRFEDMLRAVPHGDSGIRMLAVMARQQSGDSLLRERLLIELVSRDPRRKESLSAIAGYYLRELERPSDSKRCPNDRVAECLAEAERRLTALEQLAPRDPDALLLRTRLLRVSGAPEKALALLAERCPTLSGGPRTRCLHTQLELASSTPDPLPFAAAAKAYVADMCVDSDPCATALEKVADLSAGRGDWQGALGYYDRAANERSDDKLWIKVARAGVRVGAFGKVLSALDRVRNKSRFEPEYSRLTKLATSGRVVQTTK